MVATLVSSIYYVHDWLRLCSFSSHREKSQLSVVKPPYQQTQHPDVLARRHLSVCSKQVHSSSEDIFCHNHSAETTYKLHKQHVKVMSWVRLL